MKGSWLAALAWLLAAGFCAPSSAQDMARVQLNGFSLLLPPGTVVKETRLGFAGRYELRVAGAAAITQRASDPKIVVSWSAHGLANEEYRQLLIDGIGGALPGKQRMIREAGSVVGGWAALMGDERTALGIGMFGCEAGFGVTLVVGVSKDPDEQFALTRAMISSVRCSLTDANRQRPIAATQLPREFLTIPDQELATYATLQGEIVNINFTGTNITRNLALAKNVIRGLIAGSMRVADDEISLVPLGDVVTPRHRTVLWRVSLPDSPDIHLGMLWCPKLDVTFMPLYLAEGARQQRVRQIMASIGCPGDPHATPPDARPVFAAACAKGNQFACGLRKEYAF